MLFQIILLIFVLLGALALSFLVREQSLLNDYLSQPKPRERLKRREFTLEKNKARKRIGWLVIVVLTVVLVVMILTWVTIYSLKEQLDEREAQEGLSLGYEELKKYTPDQWEVTSVAWQDAVTEKEEEVDWLRYETQLAEGLQPFLGANVVTLNKEKDKGSLTLSLFIPGITANQVALVEKNLTQLMVELSKVKEIEMVDCFVSYEQENHSLVQLNHLYVRENDELALMLEN